ncbi:MULTISPECIES: glutathione S-transferase N-terminal domain-containing protein [Halocynthiibacter]|uniref:Glutathione S-transferase N-terminal domain-containing protein n=1 Tax=Halocynthiibacter halioticoli TaxID=2986804 RepID=A0AAE3IWK4_9RHOB|nr:MULTISPECIES: glutathione binding-like protein [Halocynthiibacter]MCV6823314.1 glutathione S-transferase N-terminal domain-containing protein [Halocynthiibacter halioticoli]MCW4056315.1 glutathione S-transferase N-terminal domain-containing protein [Halocynthiibacter sp. SDUM655004]
MTIQTPIKSSLDEFPITNKWAPKNPEHIQLYSLPTPNGVKVSILLEELGLPYDAHQVSFATNDQFSPEFLSLNPNNKIPAIIDPAGPDGAPVGLFETGAILTYLADKADTEGKLLPREGAARYETLQWLFWQVGGFGPMLGQLGFFHKFAGKEFEDKRPRDRYVDETKRLFGVLNTQLEGKEWITGTYSIADIAVAPWVRTVVDFYEAGDLIGIDDFPNVTAYLERFLARPAVQAGLKQPAS